MGKETVFYAVGDVGPTREVPYTIFEQVAPLIQSGDVAFCQLEPVLSERGTPLPQARLAARSHPNAAAAIKKAGFHIVSFATNHCMDWGREAFQDTIDVLKQEDLQVIGVGRNISEARKPAYYEQDGLRIAFLAYNSILPQDYWATEDRQGCVPLRAHTLYEQIEHDQPGTPCRIHTFAHRQDLKHMVEDIRKAKAGADLVIVSMHAGIHFIPAVLADYQKEMAYAAIDAGADMIIGHHAHILKGIEVYKGKAIFYSLGNFAIDSPIKFHKDLEKRKSHKEVASLNPTWKTGKGWPEDSYKTMIVKGVIEDKAIKGVSIIPVQIDADDVPRIVNHDDPDFEGITAYVKDISSSQGLNVNFNILKEEVQIIL